MWGILITVAIVALTWLIYNQYTFWKRQGVPSDKPFIPFGSLTETVFGRKATGLVILDIYKKYQERFVGIYMLFRPALLIRDVELTRDILLTNFNSFHDRGTDTNVTTELFSMRGSSWKTLRAKLTPLFSTGKLKAILPTVNEVGDKMLNHLNSKLEGNSEYVFDMKEVVTTYTIDIIGTVFFGLEIDSFKEPQNEFRHISDGVISPPTWLDYAHMMGQFACPPLARFIDLFGFIPEPAIKSREIIKHNVDFREKNNVTRRDFLQLLIQLRNSGKISEDDNWYVETAAEEFKSMSTDMIADQCLLFYIAGSETTSVTAAFTLYELSLYPKLMKEAVKEVESVLTKHNLKPTDPLTYEAIKDMKFIELCQMETLRKYPGLPFLNRECTKDYKVPNTDYTIKKGTSIIISVLGLHFDSEYFPDPLKYDPYRFTEDQRNYNPEAYMPFGEGPHQCIAKRMGSVNSKIAIAKILANFNIEPKEHKDIELDFSTGVALIPKGGLMMKVTRKTV